MILSQQMSTEFAPISIQLLSLTHYQFRLCQSHLCRRWQLSCFQGLCCVISALFLLTWIWVLEFGPWMACKGPYGKIFFFRVALLEMGWDIKKVGLSGRSFGCWRHVLEGDCNPGPCWRKQLHSDTYTCCDLLSCSRPKIMRPISRGLQTAKPRTETTLSSAIGWWAQALCTSSRKLTSALVRCITHLPEWNKFLLAKQCCQSFRRAYVPGQGQGWWRPDRGREPM